MTDRLDTYKAPTPIADRVKGYWGKTKETTTNILNQGVANTTNLFNQSIITLYGKLLISCMPINFPGINEDDTKYDIYIKTAMQLDLFKKMASHAANLIVGFSETKEPNIYLNICKMMYILDSNVRHIVTQTDGNERLKRLNAGSEFNLITGLTLANDMVSNMTNLNGWSDGVITDAIVITGGKSRKARRRRGGSRKLGAKKQRHRTRSR